MLGAQLKASRHNPSSRMAFLGYTVWGCSRVQMIENSHLQVPSTEKKLKNKQK
jgi:hypothetical protein